MLPLLALTWTVMVYTFCALFRDELNELQPVKQLKYDVSLQYSRLTQSTWWNRIEPTAHYLGAQPQADLGHALTIARQLRVDTILMVVEDFEAEGGWFHKPVQASEWEDLGLAFYIVRARDGQPLRFTEIDEGVQLLRWETAHNRSVYMHCKAGRGRSAAIMWAHLALTYNMEGDEALKLLAKQRVISLNRRQREAVVDYLEYKRCVPGSDTCYKIPEEWFTEECVPQ
jgi:atypical dual specificity phosphatase